MELQVIEEEEECSSRRVERRKEIRRKIFTEQL